MSGAFSQGAGSRDELPTYYHNDSTSILVCQAHSLKAREAELSSRVAELAENEAEAAQAAGLRQALLLLLVCYKYASQSIA